MPTRLSDILNLIEDLTESDLRMWIREGLIRPEQSDDDFSFSRMDVARTRLMVEIRHHMGLQEEALPLIFHLLDQVYDMRRSFRQLESALGEQPESIRESIEEAFRRISVTEDQ